MGRLQLHTSHGLGTLLIVIFLGKSSTSRCQHREPVGILSSDKTVGDSGFSIQLSGDPQTYQPGATYTLSLSGDSTELGTKKINSVCFGRRECRHSKIKH